MIINNVHVSMNQETRCAVGFLVKGNPCPFAREVGDNPLLLYTNKY